MNPDESLRFEPTRFNRNAIQELLLLVSFIFFAANLHSQQNLFFKHLGYDQGLSNNQINCIVRDQMGYVWIGTNDGLNRYDGSECVVYRTIKGDRHSISGVQISDLLIDKTGILWIASFDGGLSSYSSKTGKFTQHTGQQQEVNKSPKGISKIHETKGGEFWVASENNGFFQFNKTTGEFSRPKQKELRLRNRYLTINSDDQSVYFGQLASSVFRMKGNSVKQINSTQGKFPVPGQTINCMFLDSFQNVWMGAWDNGLHRYDRKTEKFETRFTLKNEPFSYAVDQITSIQSVGKYLWLGTRSSGICIYNPVSGTYSNLEHTHSLRNSLSSNTITCMYKDEEGLVWVGTDAGVNIYDPRLNQFEWVFPSGSSDKTDFNEKVFCMSFSDNAFYIGTLKGLWHRQKDEKQFTFHPLSFDNTRLKVHSIYPLKSGRILLGTNKSAYFIDPPDFMPHGVNRFYSNDTNSAEAFVFLNLSASRINSISPIIKDGKPLLLFSVVGYGVAVFDPEWLSGFHSPVIQLANSQNKGLENMLNKIVLRRDGTCWLLSQNHGILNQVDFTSAFENEFVFKKPTGVKNVVTSTQLNDVFNARQLFNPQKYPDAPINVSDLVENANSTFYISSFDKGLFLVDPSKPTIKAIPSLHRNQEGMIKDKLGRLWIVSSGGFDVYSPEKNSWQRLGPSNGLPEKGVHGYIQQDENGDFYAGSYGCYIKFNPESFHFAESPPTIAITHLKLFNKQADTLLNADRITLNYDENFITLAFTGFDHTGFFNPQFEYMLEGLDKSWVKAGDINSASYTNLPGGDYTFKVRVPKSDSGVPLEKSIRIVILPPFWKTAWFVASLIVCLIIVAILFYRFRFGQIRAKQQEIHKTEIAAQEQERKRLSQDLHDDLGTRLSALKLFVNSIGKGLIPDSPVHELQQNAEQLLDESIVDLRTILLNLSPDSLNNYGYFKAIEELVFKIRSSGVFTISMTVTGEPVRFELQKELALFRITQELISNSIKHANAKVVSIQVLCSAGQISLFYEDDGKGFDINKKKSGLGLQNIANRLEVFEGSVNWDTSVGHGMRAVIDLPL